MICDILSRWAYPASKTFRDLLKHGSEQDVEDVRKILAQEARDIAEQEKFKASQKEQHPPVTVSPGDDLRVALVGAEAESSTSAPMRFTFRDPAVEVLVGVMEVVLDSPGDWGRVYREGPPPA